MDFVILSYFLARVISDFFVGGLTGVRLLLNPEWSNMGSLTQLGRIEDRQTILISYF